MKLDEKASYDALSYAWGQDQTAALPDRPFRVKRSASGTTQTINVTRSVESALERLWYDNRNRPIWIDQISIDQDDWEEKSAQMKIMGYIYEASSLVIVWLGEKSKKGDDCDDSDEALRFTQEVVQAFDEGKDLAPYMAKLPLLRAVNALLRRMWFERAWTLEEVANARKCEVHCGRKQLDYSVFHQFYRNCQEEQSSKWREMLLCIAAAGPKSTRNDERPILAHIVAIGKLRELKERHRQDKKDSHPPDFALMRFNNLRSCQTKDAKDKVYSLYYHLPEEIKAGIKKPDYGISVEELYRRLAVSQICKMGNLTYLAAAGIYRRNLSVPSWVPDYTYPETHYSLSVLDEDCFNRTGTHLFAAANEEQASPHLEKDGRALQLRGRILCSVKDVVRPFSFSSFGNRGPIEKANLQMKEVERQYKECQEMIGSYKDNMKENHLSPLTLLRLNLTCGMEVQNAGPSFGGVFVPASIESIDQRFQALEVYVKAVQRLTGGMYVDSKKLDDKRLENGRMEEGGFQIMVYNCSQTAAFNNINDCKASGQPAQAVMESFVGACRGRALFITDDGVLGLGPNVTRKEDKVCVIHGCRVPFIIRRIEELKKRQDDGSTILQAYYVLVGECYVHGIMNGEALKDEVADARDIFLL